MKRKKGIKHLIKFVEGKCSHTCNKNNFMTEHNSTMIIKQVSCKSCIRILGDKYKRVKNSKKKYYNNLSEAFESRLKGEFTIYDVTSGKWKNVKHINGGREKWKN